MNINKLTWEDAAMHLDYRCEFYDDEDDIQWVSSYSNGLLTVTAMDINNDKQKSWEFRE